VSRLLVCAASNLQDIDHTTNSEGRKEPGTGRGLNSIEESFFHEKTGLGGSFGRGEEGVVIWLGTRLFFAKGGRMEKVPCRNDWSLMHPEGPWFRETCTAIPAQGVMISRSHEIIRTRV